MNTKRVVRWVIVLFLLAALPGMTAVMARAAGGQSAAAGGDGTRRIGHDRGLECVRE